VSRDGGCLCGAVRYTVDGPLREILVCHCVECRRWAGRAWTATAARVADLDIVDPDAVLWIPSPGSDHGAERGSCRACGASLFWRIPGGERVSISAGTLDEPTGLRIAAHIWVDHSAEWDRPPRDLPAYPRGYPADARALEWAE
jgi:hypothetical protein